VSTAASSRDLEGHQEELRLVSLEEEQTDAYCEHLQQLRWSRTLETWVLLAEDEHGRP
jgi:hypothetical protein